MLKKIKEIVVLSIIVLSLVSCGGTVDVAVSQTKKVTVVENLPSWYFQDISDTNKLYGVGVGTSMSDAIDNALIDCLSKLVITIDSSVQNSITVTQKNDESIVDKVFISKTVQKVKKTFTSEYYIEKFQNLTNNKAVQISLKKEELINNIILNIVSEENSLKSFQVQKLNNENILSRISSLSNAIKYSKKIDFMLVMLSSLGKNYPENQRTAKYVKLLESEYSNLNIYFKNNMNPQTYDDMHAKVSKNFKKNIDVKLLKNNEDIRLTNNDIVFNFTSCAEAYTAIRANRKFWQSGMMPIYVGCNKVTIEDNNKNELYSRRVAGIKIKDYETISQASHDSYHSKESQKEIADMLEEFTKHEYLQHIIDEAI